MVTSTFNKWLRLRAKPGAMFALSLGVLCSGYLSAAPVAQTPLFLTQGVEPQVMLSMSNDHQLFFEAYPDYLDLDGDGTPNTTYTHANDYYGYFDSFKCYNYDTADGRFEPAAVTANKYCDSVSGNWSGNFLNYITMSRNDVVRKILYGGLRQTDTSSLTVLERSYLPTDAHSWVRFYDGNDLNQLTPFTNPDPVSASSASAVTVGKGSKTFKIVSNTTEFFDTVERGDQIVAYSSTVSATVPSINNPGSVPMMLGRVTGVNSGNNDVTVDVEGVNGTGSFALWTLVNPTRAGVSFCNTTDDASLNDGERVPSSKPPRVSVASGNYSLWSANERWQCQWSDEKGAQNANNIGVTESAANDRNPVRSNVGLGQDDYIVRVEVCNSGLLGTERCKEYPDGNYKPIGLLQQYGDDEQILFGLLSGSYVKNKSGGVLRKNVSKFSDEVNVDTDGTFKAVPTAGSIVDTLNVLRMYGYNSNGVYRGNSEDCNFQLNSFPDGRCVGWGNPQSEIFMEAIRYFGGASPTSAFTFTGQDRLVGLQAQAWSDTLDEDNYCAPLNVINFNGSVASYDRDQLGTVSALPEIDTVAELRSITDKIGLAEGINGNDWFIGENGTLNNQLCTSKTLGSLADAVGLCPEAPRLEGGYDAVGLAHHAYTEDMRTDLKDDQFIQTFAVALAPAVPRIDIPLPNSNRTAVTMLPACRNGSIGGNCALVDFKVIRQDQANGTGKFLVNWEDSEQGGDFDQDMYGVIEYTITSSTLTVTTQVGQESTSGALGFGYVLSGTTKDGFHAHSGIEGFDYNDPTGVTDCNNCQVGDAATTVSYTLNTSGASDGLLEAPMFYAAKWGGYDKQANFPTDSESWDANGDGLPDNYYFAIDPKKLADDLEKVFSDILRSSASAASVAANSTSLSTETTVYQASFNSQLWSGDLKAFEVESDGSLSDTFDWSAAQKLDSLSSAGIDARNIITNTPMSATGATAGELLSTGGIDFKWSQLTTAQKDALRLNIDGSLSDLTLAESRLEFLRGDRDNERTSSLTGRPFRERGSRLGDIINSNPQFIYRQDFGYGTLDEKASFSSITPYKDWRQLSGGVYQSKPPVVVVGSNDGMLHGFNADPDSSEVGQELFAYVPSDIFSNLSSLTYPDYSHSYFVDGTPRISDVWLGATDGWATLAVGSSGAGGDSIFALDITDPENVGPNQLLWEFSHPDKGRTLGQPAVVALYNGEFGVVVTSGYEDVPDTDGGKIWVLNARTGRPIKTFELPDSGELGAPLVVDLTQDRIADRIYVGDTLGKLWRLDIDDSNTNKWGVPTTLKDGSTLEPLFVAQTGQAITAPLTSAFNEKDEHMVFFGTGSFYRVGQNVVPTNPPVETFYGIIDKGLPIVNRSTLLEQEILVETVASGQKVRVVSDNGLSSEDGWYLDLVVNGEDPQGERVVSRALIRGDRVIFPTVVPSRDACSAGGESFLMELSMFSGGRLSYSVFDVNEDGNFDDSDWVVVRINGVDVKVPVSGLAPNIGVISTPTIIAGVGSGDETKVISGSSGKAITVPEKGSIAQGRQNWQQLR